jgi:hypothetical protein
MGLVGVTISQGGESTTIYVGSTYYYWLEDVELDGTTTVHADDRTTVDEVTAVTRGELSHSRSSRWRVSAVVSLMLTLLIS